MLSMSTEDLEAFSDSQLVVSQVNDQYETKDNRMTSYLSLVLRAFKITQVPRSENALSDSVALFTSMAPTYQCNVELKILDRPSFMPIIATTVQAGNLKSWATSILCYLKNEHLLNDKKEEYKIKKRSARYIRIKEELYRRMYTNLYLRCLEPHQAIRVIRKIHEGTCGSNIGERSLAYRI